MTEDLFDLRQARASLAWLFEPGDAALRDLVAVDGPVGALDRLAGADRPAGLRAELRHTRAEHLWAAAAGAVDAAERAGWRIVIPEDPQWPAGLADPAAAPAGRSAADAALAGGADVPEALCLWIRGDLSVADALARSVAVIGTRAATDYGIHVAAGLGCDLAGLGWTVLATGALGIDAAAHRGALTGAGATVAVLPGGLDRPYPAANADLFDRIAEHGLLVSAWPTGATPTRTRRVANQRLLAALAGGVVVVEATPRSAALTSLRQAIMLGRPAMVVPGPVTSALSVGCHLALREHPQVRLVTGAGEVVAELDNQSAP